MHVKCFTFMKRGLAFLAILTSKKKWVCQINFVALVLFVQYASRSTAKVGLGIV